MPSESQFATQNQFCFADAEILACSRKVGGTGAEPPQNRKYDLLTVAADFSCYDPQAGMGCICVKRMLFHVGEAGSTRKTSRSTPCPQGASIRSDRRERQRSRVDVRRCSSVRVNSVSGTQNFRFFPAKRTLLIYTFKVFTLAIPLAQSQSGLRGFLVS